MSVTERFADDLTREERLNFLRHVYNNVNEQVRYSNQKASYILTSVGAVFVGCGAALLGPNVENVLAKALLGGGLVCTSLAGAAASVAIFPVMKGKPSEEPKRSLMFFGWIAHLPPGRYAEIIGGLTEGEMMEELGGMQIPLNQPRGTSQNKRLRSRGGEDAADFPAALVVDEPINRGAR